MAADGHVSNTSDLPCIWQWFSSRERMIKPLEQLSDNRLLFLPLCYPTWEWCLDALLSNSDSRWIPCSKLSGIHKSGLCPALLLPFLEQFGQTGLCGGMTHCTVSYQWCSLREGARILAIQRKILKSEKVEQFTKIRVIFLVTEKPVDSCS